MQKRGKPVIILLVVLFIASSVYAIPLPNKTFIPAIDSPGITIKGNRSGAELGGFGRGDVGDFNGDGFADIYFADIHEAYAGIDNRGMGMIILGSPNVANLTGRPLDQNVNITIRSNVSNALGRGVLSDVNNDGFDDIIFQFVTDDFNLGDSDTNAVQIIFGSPNPPSTFNLRELEGGARANVSIRGNRSNANFGIRITTGDINGDGINDIIISAPNADPDGRTDAGEVHVVYGRTNWPSNVDQASVGFNVTVKGNFSYDRIGFVDNEGHKEISTGDINGDGFDDLIIGCGNCDPGGRTNAGMVFVLFGAANLTGIHDLRNGEINLTIKGNSSNDKLGAAVAAADIDNDGFDDLIMSAYDAEPGGIAGRGIVHVVLGGPNIAGTIDNIELNDNLTIKGNASDNWLGRAIAVAEMNNDGIMDLIFSAQLLDTRGVGNANVGGVYIIYGNTSMPSSADWDITTKAPNITIFGTNNSMQLGQGFIAAGDIDGNSFNDIVIGASGVDSGGLTNNGEIYVVFNSVGNVCGGRIECACGDKINQSRVFDSNENISLKSCVGTSGLIIDKSNIQINGNGLSIIGDGTRFGINNSKGFDNITLSNLKLFNFSVGINMTGSENSTILNNTINISSLNSGIGISLYLSNNSNIILNSINLSKNFCYRPTPNCFPVGVLKSVNTTIASNVIISKNNSQSEGIFLEKAINTTIVSNILKVSGTGNDGIYLLHSNSTNTTLNNVTIEDGFTSERTASAISIDDSSNNVFSFNNIINLGKEYSLGIELSSGTRNNFTNDNITSVNFDDIRVDRGSATFLNVSFDKTNVSFADFASGNITVKWYVNVLVTDNNNNALENANVSIKNVNNSVITTVLTSANGKIVQQEIVEFFQNRTVKKLFTPHEISASLTGYDTNSKTINLSVTNSTSISISLFKTEESNTESETTAAGSGSSESVSQASIAATTGITITGSIDTSDVSEDTGEVEEVPSKPETVKISREIKDLTQLFMTQGEVVENLALVTGDYASSETVQSLLDVALALQESASVTYSKSVEEALLANSLDTLELNTTIGDVKKSLYEKDLSIFETKDIFSSTRTPYAQKLDFNESSTSNKVVFDLNEEDKPGDYFFISQGDEVFRYHLIFDEGLTSRISNKSSTRANLPDLVDSASIYILGTPFKITNVTFDATKNGNIEITLMNGEIEAVLEENTAKTYSLSSGIFTIKAPVITENDVLFEVNGKTIPRMKAGDYYQMKGLNISVRDFIVTDSTSAPNIVRFFLNGKTIRFFDENYGDDNFDSNNRVVVNGELIEDAKVGISATVLGDKATINEILYSLEAKSNQGNVYLKAGEFLSDKIRQKAGLLSNNFDMFFEGVTNPGSTRVKFVPEGRKQYYLEFLNFEGIKYRVPFLTSERDGNLRYGKFTGTMDNNLVFIEGDNANDSVIFENDYFIVSDVLTDTVSLIKPAARFNNGSQKDTFGYTHVLQYQGYDNTSKTLSFTDLGDNFNNSKINVVVDNNGNGSLKVGGQFYGLKVNTSSGALSVDLNGDGVINGRISAIALQGGGLLLLGRTNPKKSSVDAVLGSVGTQVNVTLATISKTSSDGSDNTNRVFPFESENGEINIDDVNFLKVSLKYLNNDVKVGRDVYGVKYRLVNLTSTEVPPTFNIDFPLSQVNVVFKAKGLELDEKESYVSKFKELPPGFMKLASEIDDLSSLNTVLLGNPCDNFLIDRLFNFPKPCDKDLPDTGAVVKLFRLSNDSVSLVFAGKTPSMIRKVVNDVLKGKLKFDFSNATRVNVSNDFYNTTVEVLNVKLNVVPPEKKVQECYPIRDFLVEDFLVKWDGPTNREVAVLEAPDSFLFVKNKLDKFVKVRELVYLNGIYDNELVTELKSGEGLILRNEENVKKEVMLFCENVPAR